MGSRWDRVGHGHRATCLAGKRELGIIGEAQGGSMATDMLTEVTTIALHPWLAHKAQLHGCIYLCDC